MTALVYAKQHPSSYWIMNAALPAFLLESVFYLASVFESTRARFASLRSPSRKGLLLWGSALLPYLVFTFLAGTFHRNAFTLIALLTGLLSFWYILLPRRPAYDIGFLVIVAAPVVLRAFPRIYLSPDPHLRIDILGHLMWIRLAIAVLLILRKWDPGAFGFWPNAQEWRIGLLCYIAAIVPIVLLALATHDVHYAPARGAWWQIAALGSGVFFGALWVIAIGEELFFRGVITRALLNGWGSKVAAILISALLYGSAHLWFGHYPNWQRALTASALGLIFGWIYTQTNSVRAPMVTHALVVMTWRMFFK